jgi:uncharacterized membrane protein (DUF373 family)
LIRKQRRSSPHPTRSKENGGVEDRIRDRVVQGLITVEDAVYIGLGILLSAGAFALLYTTLRVFIGALSGGSLSTEITTLLDQILLTLLIVELLYTVQVSFREHELLVEPFLVVALIAVIRRILVLTAELHKLQGGLMTQALLELGLLTIMVIVLVAALIVLQREAKAHERSR